MPSMPRERPKRREPRPLKRVRVSIKSPKARRFSMDEIDSIVLSGPKPAVGRSCVVPGLNGQLYVRGKYPKIWCFTPIEGGGYFRHRVADYFHRVKFWDRLPEKMKRAVMDDAVEHDLIWKMKTEREEKREHQIPVLSAAEFEINIPREKFGEIYAELMNELNVRKIIDRADPFSSVVQGIRKAQNQGILEGVSYNDVHVKIPVEKKEAAANMTNDSNHACVFVHEKNGKPVIVLRNRNLSSEPPRMEIGYLAIVLENLLKELNVKYKKVTA